jgi:hypothetical protein
MKRMAIGCVLWLCLAGLYAAPVKVLVVPLLCYSEEDGSRLSDMEADVQLQFSGKLRAYWLSGLAEIFPGTGMEDMHVASVLDASRVCTAEKADYILYGYMKRGDRSWFAEVKLFEAASQSIREQFFAGDDTGHMDRLLQTLADRIADYACIEFGLARERSEPDIRHMIWEVPFEAGYWNHIDGDWADKILGTAAVSIGLELFPELDFTASANRKFAISVRADTGYRYGLGNDSTEPSVYHSVFIAGTVCLTRYLTDTNKLKFGFGPLFGTDIMIIDQKYRGKSTYKTNVSGVRFSAAYGYDINSRWSFAAGVNCDAYITENTSPIVSVYAGVTRVIRKRERTVSK